MWKTTSSKFNSDGVPASRHPAGQGSEVTALFASKAHYCFSPEYHPNFSELHVLQKQTFALSAAFVSLAGVSSSTWKRQHQKSCCGASGLAEGREAVLVSNHPQWETQKKLSKYGQYWNSCSGLKESTKTWVLAAQLSSNLMCSRHRRKQDPTKPELCCSPAREPVCSTAHSTHAGKERQKLHMVSCMRFRDLLSLHLSCHIVLGTGTIYHHTWG